MRAVVHLPRTPLSSPLVDDDLEDLPVLSEVLIAAQRRKQLFLADPGVESSNIYQIPLDHSEAREMFAVERFDLAFLCFVLSFLASEAFLLAVFSFQSTPALAHKSPTPLRPFNRQGHHTPPQ